MAMLGQFDEQGPYFTEQKPKIVDARRLQAAMFMDRPDLWRRPGRKAKLISDDQLPLLPSEPEN
jgi:hypothetical protein